MSNRNESGTSKVTKFRRRPAINIGVVIFALIFVYLVYAIFRYFNTKHIVGYEVRSGSLSANNVYEGIALREELTITSEDSGYINYFAAEGSRVAVGNLVYTIDETGSLLELLQSADSDEDEVTYSDADLTELRTRITDFASGFSPMNFGDVYDFRTTFIQTAQKLNSASVLYRIDRLNNNSRVSSIGYYNAGNSGIVVYSVDGFENTSAEYVTAASFDREAYEKTFLEGNTIVSSGDPVYKLVTDENWQIVIRAEEERVQELVDAGYIRVRFLKNQDEAWAQVGTVVNSEGETLVTLSFSNSMVTFCTDRYLNIEIRTEEQNGLKIPNTSIVEKTFYLVPRDYLTTGAEGKSGVLVQKWLENGSQTTEFMAADIYNETDDHYYLSFEQFEPGTILIKPDSTETFTLSETDTLVGVYNINKGYADFRQINILYSNDEYSIVESGTRYGLSVYDYIVLDTDTVSENEIIYN